MNDQTNFALGPLDIGSARGGVAAYLNAALNGWRYCGQPLDSREPYSRDSKLGAE
jgi:hypothetical protein